MASIYYIYQSTLIRHPHKTCRYFPWIHRHEGAIKTRKRISVFLKLFYWKKYLNNFQIFFKFSCFYGAFFPLPWSRIAPTLIRWTIPAGDMQRGAHHQALFMLFVCGLLNYCQHVNLFQRLFVYIQMLCSLCTVRDNIPVWLTPSSFDIKSRGSLYMNQQ